MSTVAFTASFSQDNKLGLEAHGMLYMVKQQFGGHLQEKSQTGAGLDLLGAAETNHESILITGSVVSLINETAEWVI